VEGCARRSPRDHALTGAAITGPRTEYTERFAHHEALRDEAARRSVRLSNLRAVTFLAAAAAWVTFDAMPLTASRITAGLAVLLTSVFVVQVVIHRRVRREERWEGALASLAREGLLRLDRNWSQLDEALPAAESMPEQASADHPYARDLSVVGPVSLARLAGPVTSERGRAILRGWLLEADEASAAEARQGAVTELTSLPDLRTHYAALGRLDGPTSLEGLERFFGWAEGGASTSQPWIRLLAWVLPPILVLGLVGYFALGWLSWWVAPAIAHVVILRRHAAHMSAAFRDSVLGGPPLKALVPQLDLLSKQDWADPTLAALSARLGRGESAAREHLDGLSRLLDSVESRRNAFYATLAPVLLLDIHLSAALDRWRAAHGTAVRDWLEALGQWEALSALATVAYEHPDWAYASFAGEGSPEVVAAQLGHPLLPPEECVRNDLSVGPPGTFLFVTGSNMSGKSTLLRAIGANAVLAAAGAPVCAKALVLPPVRVHTSMRIEDSLTEGISLFMAELLRIKEVVSAANDAEGTGRPVLYLLDEILHGTNTAERRIAARGVVRHLIASNAIGAVSSHDLTLAETPDLESAGRAIHFREEVGGPSSMDSQAMLTFDYHLRDGVATTRNALKLLGAVGLGGLTAEVGEDHA
jgi:hypothetical protein